MNALPLLIQIHVVAAAVAILTGMIVFALPKGDRRHRNWACAYVAAMMMTTGVVIFVPATVLEFGESGWGFFHLFILVGGVSSFVGVFALFKWRTTRDPAWLCNHQIRFAFSYAGLLMAGFSQLSTNPRFGLVNALTPSQFWLSFIGTNIAILAIAMFFVSRYLAKGNPHRRFAMKI